MSLPVTLIVQLADRPIIVTGLFIYRHRLYGTTRLTRGFRIYKKWHCGNSATFVISLQFEQYSNIRTEQLDTLSDEIMAELQCRILRAEDYVDVPKIVEIVELKNAKHWMKTGVLPVTSLEAYFGHPLDPAAEQLVTHVRVDILQDRTDAQNRELRMLQETMELFPAYDWFLLHRRDKGGRQRLSPICGPGAATVVARMQATPPNERVWLHVPSGMDVHAYRADYAGALYKAHARRIEDIPKDRINKGTGRLYSSEVYNCRKDERGKKLDKRAMLLVSKELGHNRLDVCSNFYLQNL